MLIEVVMPSRTSIEWATDSWNVVRQASHSHGDRALLEHWYGQLGKAERKALESLAEVYPRSLSKAQLAARAGYEANGGGFNNALSKLRTLELISGKAEIRASQDLFG